MLTFYNFNNVIIIDIVTILAYILLNTATFLSDINTNIVLMKIYNMS